MAEKRRSLWLRLVSNFLSISRIAGWRKSTAFASCSNYGCCGQRVLTRFLRAKVRPLRAGRRFVFSSFRFASLGPFDFRSGQALRQQGCFPRLRLGQALRSGLFMAGLKPGPFTKMLTRQPRSETGALLGRGVTSRLINLLEDLLILKHAEIDSVVGFEKKGLSAKECLYKFGLSFGLATVGRLAVGE